EDGAPEDEEEEYAGDEASFDGTPGYLAPECAERNVRRSATTDLYALGATLFKLMTGQLPVPFVAARPDLLVSTTTAATSALASIIARLLDPDPSARPRHAEEVARDLERARALLTAPLNRGATATTVRAALAALFAEEGLPAPLAPLLAEVRRASAP